MSEVDADKELNTGNVIYGGFWRRVLATIIDTILLALITIPLTLSIYGSGYFAITEDQPFIAGPADFLINWVLPAIAIIAFWASKEATPGKMMLNLRIVDAETLKSASLRQLVGRYFGYFVSAFPLMLGIFWVGFDKKKQGWHDKLSGTVVVKDVY